MSELPNPLLPVDPVSAAVVRRPAARSIPSRVLLLSAWRPLTCSSAFAVRRPPPPRPSIRQCPSPRRTTSSSSAPKSSSYPPTPPPPTRWSPSLRRRRIVPVMVQQHDMGKWFLVQFKSLLHNNTS